jgi:hypothetical protein
VWCAHAFLSCVGHVPRDLYAARLLHAVPADIKQALIIIEVCAQHLYHPIQLGPPFQHSDQCLSADVLQGHSGPPQEIMPWTLAACVHLLEGDTASGPCIGTGAGSALVQLGTRTLWWLAASVASSASYWHEGASTAQESGHNARQRGASQKAAHAGCRHSASLLVQLYTALPEDAQRGVRAAVVLLLSYLLQPIVTSVLCPPLAHLPTAPQVLTHLSAQANPYETIAEDPSLLSQAILQGSLKIMARLDWWDASCRK